MYGISCREVNRMIKFLPIDMYPVAFIYRSEWCLVGAHKLLYFSLHFIVLMIFVYGHFPDNQFFIWMSPFYGSSLNQMALITWILCYYDLSDCAQLILVLVRLI